MNPLPNDLSALQALLLDQQAIIDGLPCKLKDKLAEIEQLELMESAFKVIRTGKRETGLWSL